jgi:hypothetical protein
MAIEFPDPPPHATSLADAGVSLAARSALEHDVSSALATLTEGTSRELVLPHATYNLDAYDIAERRPLAVARLTAWRYLVKDAGSPMAAAEVAVDAAGHASAFSSLNMGPFVSSTMSALAAAEKIDAVANGRYQPRLLRIPELYVMALWLKAEKAGEDIVVPMSPAPEELTAGRGYDEAAFLEGLASSARQRITMAGQHKD